MTAAELRTASMCTGYGGLDLSVHQVLGGTLAWVAEIDPDASKVLACRFPGVPNHGDLTAVDWTQVEPVDVLTAGFPCQDVSCAGARKGLRAGTRTGVWSHVARAIEALRPSLVVLENVRGLLSAAADSNVEQCPWCLGDSGAEHALRALGAVLGDLADLGFDAAWRVVRASDAGAPHKRERVFIVARPAENTDGTACGERRVAATGETESWGSRADACRSGGARAAADADAGRRGPGEHDLCAGKPDASRGAPADADRRRLAELKERDSGALPGIDGSRGDDTVGRVLDWGPYQPAVARWEDVLGRPAPRPTVPGKTAERLSPVFVEWMQGLPEGWVTDVPGLSRNAQLKLLGNGVVPQQGDLALRLLLAGPGLAELGEAA